MITQNLIVRSRSRIPAATLDGTLTLNGQAFDAGAVNAQINTSGAGKGLAIVNTQDSDYGAYLEWYNLSASPAVNDRVTMMSFWGEDSNSDKTEYGSFLCRIENVTHTTECGYMEWYNAVNGALNLAMTLSSAGLLSVDAAGAGTGLPSLFDEYDDAIVLKDGIQHHNRELLSDIGVMERKGNGYMLRIQPMLNLLAGGIYQNRQLIEDKFAQLEERIKLALPQGA